MRSPQIRIQIKTIAVLVLTTLLAAIAISFLLVKPYRATLEVVIKSAAPSPVFAYFSSTPGGYSQKKISQSQEEAIEMVKGSQTARHRIKLASFSHLISIRLDPAADKGTFEIQGMKLIGAGGTLSFSPQEIYEMAIKGSQMVEIRQGAGAVTFVSTGNDPHFEVVYPKSLLADRLFPRPEDCLEIWLVVSTALLAAIFFLYRNHLPLFNEGSFTAAQWLQSIRTRAFAEFLLEIIAATLLVLVTRQFVALHSGIHWEPLTQIFAKDGVGDSVPKEVRTMKLIVARQGFRTYALAGDLGRGEEYNDIYHRATEYLYPARVDNKSRLIFARSDLKELYERRNCTLLDIQESILLYDCEK